MAINFSGEFTTTRSPEEVFDFLSDPKQFAPLLPDFQSMSMQDPTHFTVKVKVGVGNIRGSAELKMELSEAVKPLRAQYKGQGTAVGSQVTVSAGFDLSPLPESTRVAWQGETSVYGKLASMAGGMLEPLGRKNIQKLIDGLQKALATPVGAATAATPTSAASAPVEAPGFSPTTDDSPQGSALAPEHSGRVEVVAPALVEAPSAGPENAAVPQSGTPTTVEAPDFSPTNSEPEANGALAPAEGDHGDRNP